ncbi:unnamed protein product [Amaranthus hypochondriacus]
MMRKQYEVMQLISKSNVSMFGLLETKIKRSNFGQVYSKFFSGWCITNNLAHHKNGRIVIGWNPAHMQVDVTFCSSQIIHLKVIPVNEKPFAFSFVYGSNDKEERCFLFNKLNNIASSCVDPWIVLDDFNCLANLDERIGQPVRLHEIQPLRHCMSKCQLFYMRSKGRFFTWNNKQAGTKRVFSKIDRVLCNTRWSDDYPSVEAIFLLEGAFDHSPALVQFFPLAQGRAPFKFFNFWASKESFIDMVKETSQMSIVGHLSYQIQQKLCSLKSRLKEAFQRTPIQVA